MNSSYKKIIQFGLCLLLGFILWQIPTPEAIAGEGTKLFAVFVATILALVLRPFPMGQMALFSLSILILFNVFSINTALSGFANPLIWLVILAFFMARGMIKTGLGHRIACLFVYFFGKKTLGLAYGFAFCDLLMAPAIPSVTARTGGILFPIVKSLAESYGSYGNDDSRKKIGDFMIQSLFQTTVITCAMFATAMAGSILAIELASSEGIIISWGDWALAAFVPGLVSLLVIPFFLYKTLRPETTETPNAKKWATDELKKMGKLSLHEITMLGTFFLLLVLWIFGQSIGIHATTAALIGVNILLFTNVLEWDDILNEKSAWGTYIWFAVLVLMAGQLKESGLITWGISEITPSIEAMGLSPFLLITLIIFIFTFSHYFFASATAHIGALYLPLLILGIQTGLPKQLTAILLAVFGSLCGGLTHYSLTPAPLLYSAGYSDLSVWWRNGLSCILLNMLIWGGVGSIWWKFLGLY